MPSLTKPSFTAEQIREEMERAKKHLDAVPEDLKDEALKGLEFISENADGFTTIGTFGIAKVWSITGLNPDYKTPASGGYSRAEIIAGVQKIGDSMMDNEDREIAEAKAARKAALDIGLKVVQIVVPLLLAAI